ncbi:hypothetical protein SteCoe_9899 [Stentor coeruleus]|uniref:protein-serine/threonine phosphatase n=1 Tax=Stentor coeruleus TaxID=5963 RepID=A0A1R2CH03_9CILI|nr:hypothetical protein SteCoe_9899 [Stentor coeruleus]
MFYLNSPSQKENLEDPRNKPQGHIYPSTPQTKRILNFASEATSPVNMLSSRNSEKRFFHKDVSLNVKASNKENGIVKAFAAVTDQGLVRNYNEDRVSIILNIMKPPHRNSEKWPFCSFFGIYDGHGGSKCADFLRDNLHQLIIRDPRFPFNASEAILEGFRQAEKIFTTNSDTSNPKEKSGSCALIIMIVGDICYVANLGDSRAIMSGKSGRKVYTLSKDHKPCDVDEMKRIIDGGGKVYQSSITIPSGQSLPGPYRASPGRLSVSRTIGDLYAKSPELGGNPEVIIALPEIKAFKILPEYDFIIIGSDGVFDKLTNKEIIQSSWSKNIACVNSNPHMQAANAVNNVITAAMNKRSLDNLTVVLIAFENFHRVPLGPVSV